MPGPHPPLTSRSLNSLSLTFPCFFFFLTIIFFFYFPLFNFFTRYLPVIFGFSNYFRLFAYYLPFPPTLPSYPSNLGSAQCRIHIGLARPQGPSALSPFYNFLYDLPVSHVICLIIMLSNGGWENRELGFLICYSSFCFLVRRLDE